MKILFYVLQNKDTGLGHWYRSLALAKQAHQMGHKVVVVSNRNPRESFRVEWYQVRVDVLRAYANALYRFRPDWVVVDLPEINHALKLADGFRVCALDGIGHKNNSFEKDVDLNISQGLEGEYCAPDYLVLRPELFRYSRLQNSDEWFVFGGASDELGLLPAFHGALPKERAMLIITDHIETADWYQSNSTHWLAKSEGDAFAWLAGSKAAALHMGMTVWESIAIGIPAYVFSRTRRHKKSAKLMEEKGWIKAWNRVGLPGKEELAEFLLEPFEPEIGDMDLGNGAKWIVELLERQ